MTVQEEHEKNGFNVTISTRASVDRVFQEAGPSSVLVVGRKHAFNARLILSCCTFASSAMLFGYDDKLISPLASLPAFVVRYQGPGETSEVPVFSAHNQILFFSVPLLGAIFGAIGSPMLNNRFGRKAPLILAYLFSLGATILELFAPSLTVFVAGRFWNAIAMGIATSTAPLYLSEVVPYHWRGMAVNSSNVLNLISGVIATAVVNSTQKKSGKTSYFVPLVIQCFPPVFLILMTLFVPESPQWLISKGRSSKAKIQLRLLRGFSDELVDEELRVLEICEDNERETIGGTRIAHLFNRQNFCRTLTAGSVFSFNQVSGIILSTTFSTIFLVEIGVADPFTLSVIGSCCVLAGSLVGAFLIDRLGRRILALSGMSVLFLIDVVAGTLAFQPSRPAHAMAIAVLSFFFNFVWAASFYSLSMLLPTEIATPKLRNMTMSYSIICAYITAITTTFCVPLIVSPDVGNLGAKTYLVFAGCMVLIIIFYYIFLPETSRRSFAEIDEMFFKKIPMRKWKTYNTSTAGKMRMEAGLEDVGEQ